MAVWVAIILGAIQGITEFLPLSSSGHLLLIENLLNAPISQFFNLLMHLATLIAVVLFFWKDVIFTIKNPFSKQSLCLILSTFCTIAIAYAISFIPGIFEGLILGPSFIVTSLILILSEIVSSKRDKSMHSKIYNSQQKYFKKNINNYTPHLKQLSQKNSISITKKTRGDVSASNAFVVGLVQGLAVLPGISRSGSTISTLKFMGVKNNNATTYSFLLSVPIIIGGIALEFFKNPSATQNIGIIPCLVGFAFAFVFGLFSLVILNKLIKNNKWWVFAPYLLILGVLVTIWQYV